jgi:hypothetical protein
MARSAARGSDGLSSSSSKRSSARRAAPTSSKESYGKTLQFYLDLGFEVSASLADFYAPGDALIILYKQIPAAS